MSANDLQPAVVYQAPGDIDPMQEENDNNEEETYEVDIDIFDLETYANNYSGLARIYRLMYIADHSSKLRPDALRLAISHIITTMNTNLYQVLHQKLQQFQGNLLPDVTGANNVDVAPLTYNASWVETTTQKASIKLEKLDSDLKNYKSNSIKESIRRGHNEIGDHHVSCGDLIEATKSYSKARDYCTSSYHVISMCLNIIKVGIYLQNWSHVENYIIKAETTPDYTENPDILKNYSSTLKCLAGLADLANRKYKSAAHNFLRANLDHCNSTEVMTTNDVAIYGGLCALATFNRLELQNNIICNNSFKSFLELEPEIRDAIFKFYESKYEVCLTILNKRKPSLLLDMFIGSHIKQLYSNIRSKAMIQYFTPYDSADMRKMALCFNTSLPDLEDELMKLIIDGHIKARIDSINKILFAKHTDKRVETFQKALCMAEQYSKQMHILILRSQLIKHQTNEKNSERRNNTGKINIDFVKRTG
ncbi:Winged helix-turn-helix DNA-binding domain,26S proteasome regulatory subunit Rpn7/COP9 signalosome [Cinara cedri]|uniref:Winged helix-turn-helix DNA-binding domain,26S proteasome regulatory subunit Rpn7/COP9 signalosome n=1 Tax=Cinara cedri TaxID=506608 RepID=A0A5E4NM81_9HEMI|nr:Winged helix-turn-helix DNA-binding domain,26S proteasome regulatory subunit Rpn7/COP9 signalosome [Cinara cedri]